MQTTPPDIEKCALILLSRAFTINEALECYKTHLINEAMYHTLEPFKIDPITQADYDASPFLLEKDKAVHALADAVVLFRLANRSCDLSATLAEGVVFQVSTLAAAICDYHYTTINTWARRQVAKRPAAS